MSTRVSSVIDRILKLRNEFEDREILEAIRQVRATLSRESSSTKQSKGKGARSVRAIPRASRVVLALEKTDPDRFEVLTTLDSLLREGKVLPSLDAIRTVGVSLDKSFDAGKSRKDAIPKLMTLLVNLPLDQLREIVRSLFGRHDELQDTSDEQAYSKLAAFLIHGKSEK